MDFSNAFRQSFGEQLAPHLDGRKEIENAVSDMLHKATNHGDETNTARFIDGEFNDMIKKAFGIIFLGFLIAIPGYWISGANFLVIPGIFYTTHLSLLYKILRQACEYLYVHDSTEHKYECQEMVEHGLVTISYVLTCTLFYIIVPVYRFWVSLDTGQASWAELAMFWVLVFLVLGFFQMVDSPWRKIANTYAVYRSWDDVVKTPAKFVLQCLVSSLFLLSRFTLSVSNTLLYRYYRLKANEPEDSWLMEDFEYQPIVGRRDFRLLKIPRRYLGEHNVLYGLSLSDTGRCELLHFDLDQAPPYECISYTWGAGLPEIPVNIEGQCVFVTPKAYEILSERRSLVRDRYVWVDQICINQNDLREKETQIPLMRDIYSHASRVVVHLGSRDRQVYASIRSMIREIGTYPQITNSDLTSLATRAMFIKYTNTPEWNALMEFLAHPLFSRIWIVQEVAMARKLEILVGDNYIPWAIFVAAIRHLQASGLVKHSDRFGPTQLSPMQSASHFRHMLACRGVIVGGDTPKFSNVLLKFQDFDATNVRDKVIALIGVSDARYGYDENGRHELVDYSADPAVLMCRTAGYLIEHDQYLDTMCVAGIGWREPQEGMPSWVPDWRMSSAAPTGFKFLDRMEKEPFFVSKRTRQSLRKSSSNTFCIATGAMIGIVKEMSAPFNVSDEEVDDSSEFTEGIFKIKSRWLAEVLEMIRHVVLHQPEESLFDNSQVVWATLVAGRDNEGWFVSAEFLERVAYWESQFADLAGLRARIDQDIRSLERGDSLGEYKDFTATQAATGNTGMSYGGRVAVISNMFLGLVPPKTQEGDIVCCFFGAQTPVILRRRINDKGMTEGYYLVGTCYVQGAMLGELSEFIEDAAEDFTLY